MSTLLEKLAKLRETLADDGSKELADQWTALVRDAQEVEVLLKNSAFSKILDKMRVDFLARVNILVKQDPELAAMRRMFVRTFGMKNAEKKIEESLEQYIDSADIE